MADNNTTINPDNVTTGSPVEGACAFVSFDPDVTIPTDATTDLTAASSGFENLGELSEQGYTLSNSTEVNKFKGWHGKTLLSEVSGEEDTLKIELVEVMRPTANKLRYGADAVTESNGFVSAIEPDGLPKQIVCVVIDELFANGTKQRTVAARAKAESVDDEAHQKGSLLVYGMTFSLLADETGKPYHKYRAVPAADDDDDDDDDNG